MGTSERSFNQVKSILGKLDRSITEARDRRTRGPLPASPSEPSPVNPAASTQPTPPATPPAPGKSGYGRATPLPPRNTQPPLRWGA
jgi:hypothetical protein